MYLYMYLNVFLKNFEQPCVEMGYINKRSLPTSILHKVYTLILPKA